jgi:hypothetical protein
LTFTRSYFSEGRFLARGYVEAGSTSIVQSPLFGDIWGWIIEIRNVWIDFALYGSSSPVNTATTELKRKDFVFFEEGLDSMMECRRGPT